MPAGCFHRYFSGAWPCRVWWVRRAEPDPVPLGLRHLRTNLWPLLPIHDRAVVLVVFLAILPIVADLVRQRILIQLDAEAWSGRQIEVATTQHEGFLQVALAQTDLLLAKEIRNRRRQLHARGQRNGAERVVRRDGSVIGLGHAGDEAHLGDAARVTEVRLQNGGRLLFQDFAETPFREHALSGGDRQMGAAGDFRHDVVILRLARLLDEHRLVRLQGLDEDLGQSGADGAVKIDGDVDVVARGFAQLGEFLGGVVHLRRRFEVAGRTPLGRPGLEGREATGHLFADLLRRAGVSINANPLTGRTAQEL